MKRDDEAKVGHLPPHSTEAEQHVLGAILLANEAFDACAAIIGEGDFYVANHRKIWCAIAQQVGSGKSADAVTVVAALDQAGELQAVGGVEYVGGLQALVPTARNVETYARIIRERSLLRQLGAAATQLHALAANPMGRKVSELVDEAARIFDAFDQGESEEVQPIGAYLVDLIERIEDRRNRGEIQGLSTGLRDLDRITAGLQKSDLILIAGRPSQGKSALAMQIAQYAALHSKSVVVFSLEMSRDQLLERMISNVGTVDADSLRTGQLSNESWEGVSAALGALRDVKLLCYDASDMTVQRVRSIARRAKRKQGCDLIVLDYLQLLTPDGDSENRNSEIQKISSGLKAMAKELDCPVVALSQLSRKVEERMIKKPVMSDLRDSGALEQDADVIALLYRDEYYNDADDNPMKGIAEIIIAKQRMGRTGTVYTEFSGEYSRFRNMSHEWRRPEQQKRRIVKGIQA